jgi:hypothetical protein
VPAGKYKSQAAWARPFERLPPKRPIPLVQSVAGRRVKGKKNFGAPDEVEESGIPKLLQFLAYLWTNILIVWVNRA